MWSPEELSVVRLHSGHTLRAGAPRDGQAEDWEARAPATLGKRASSVADRAYPALSANVTVFAIGDIHGRADLLARAHRAIDRASVGLSGRICEIYLGDYIDRGPDSAATIDLLLQRARGRETIFLRGNHEIMLQQFLDGELSLKEWARYGGLRTLLSYDLHPADWRSAAEGLALFRARFPAAHRDFIRDLRDRAWFGDYYFVHAGVRPGLPLNAQSAADMCWIREEFLNDRRDHGAIVVHGHTPADEPEFFSNRINLDTAAYLSGRLSCLWLDGEGARLLGPNGESGPLLSPRVEAGFMRRLVSAVRNPAPDRSVGAVPELGGFGAKLRVWAATFYGREVRI